MQGTPSVSGGTSSRWDRAPRPIDQLAIRLIDIVQQVRVGYFTGNYERCGGMQCADGVSYVGMEIARIMPFLDCRIPRGIIRASET